MSDDAILEIRKQHTFIKKFDKLMKATLVFMDMMKTNKSLTCIDVTVDGLMTEPLLSPFVRFTYKVTPTEKTRVGRIRDAAISRMTTRLYLEITKPQKLPDGLMIYVQAHVDDIDKLHVAIREELSV